MDDDKSVDFHGPGGFSVRARGYRATDLLCFTGFVLNFAVAGLLYIHIQDVKDHRATIVGVMKEMTAAQNLSVQVQRELNCLIAIPQEQRSVEFCRRVTK